MLEKVAEEDCISIAFGGTAAAAPQQHPSSWREFGAGGFPPGEVMGEKHESPVWGWGEEAGMSFRTTWHH